MIENGEFTTGKPWIALNGNYRDINVEATLKDPNAIFYTYLHLVHLRKDNPILVWGSFELLNTADDMFSYYREYEGERWLVIANLSDKNNEFF